LEDETLIVEPKYLMQHNKSYERLILSGEGEIDLNDPRAMNYMSPMQNEKLKELQSTSENFAK
jgi:hypothetical protein